MWGFLKGLGKVVGGLTGLGGGGVDYDKLATMIGGAGAGLSAYGQSAAGNRDGKYAGQLDLEQLLMDRDKQYFDQSIDREKEGRAGLTDAWQKLLAAEHVGSPGARPQLSPYSVARRQPTETELFGADQMKQEVLRRLQGGNPIAVPQQRPLSIDPTLLNAGTGEKVSGWLGAGLGALGGLRRRYPMDEKPRPNGGK